MSEDWILTAAHCSRYNETYMVHVGSSLKHIGGTFHFVTEKILHPNYVRPTHDYDFAVLKVSIVIITATSIDEGTVLAFSF